MENFEKLNRLELTSIVNLKQSKGMETTTQIQEEIEIGIKLERIVKKHLVVLRELLEISSIHPLVSLPIQ